MKTRDDVGLFIHKSLFEDWDVIAIGSIDKLEKLSKKEKYFDLIKHSRFGGIPILVLDSCSHLKDAKNCIKGYEIMLRDLGLTGAINETKK